MDNSLDQIMKQYVLKVAGQLGLTEAYLYGSHTKGTADENSDIDVAFIYSKPVIDIEMFYSIYGQLYNIAAEFDVDIEPVLLEANDDFFSEVKKTGQKILV